MIGTGPEILQNINNILKSTRIPEENIYFLFKFEQKRKIFKIIIIYRFMNKTLTNSTSKILILVLLVATTALMADTFQ